MRLNIRPLHNTLRSTVFASIAFVISMATVAKEDQQLNRVVAVVDSSVILQSELSQALSEARASNANLNPKDLEALVLRQMILNTIQRNMLARSSIQISDEQLNSTLLSLANQQGNAAKIDLKTFQQALDQGQPGAYAKLRKQVREDLGIEQLRTQRVNARINISDQQVERFLNSNKSKSLFKPEFLLESLVITSQNDIKSVPQLSNLAAKIKHDMDINTDIQTIVADNQKYKSKDIAITGGNLGWKKLDVIPPNFVSQIIALAPQQTTEPIIKAKEIFLFRLVQKRTTDVVIIPQRKVSHILVKVNDTFSDDQAKLKIDDIYTKIQRGEDFGLLAGAYSEDTGSASREGDLGWVSTGDMVIPFENMIVQTTVGDYSRPFRTQFGWHILKVFEERQNDVTKQFKQNAARKALMQQQFKQAQDEWLKEIYAAAYVDIKTE